MPADLREYFRIDPGDLPGEAIIFGRTEAMREVHRKIGCVLESDLPVLLLGERGTGKDLVARFLHLQSSRRDAPFVKLSCSAFPQSLLEAELLGCEADCGPSGSGEAKPGLVEMAEGGTLFLDEIGELSLSLQRKLLFLFQDGRYFRVGGREERQARVRIICATNVHLASAVREGSFRDDLFNHMDGMCFRLAALRERMEDIPQLWTFFAEKLARKFGKNTPPLTPSVLQILEGWNWPGNLCELENCIARVVVLGDEVAMGTELRRQAAMAKVPGADEEGRHVRVGSFLPQALPESSVPQTLEIDRRDRQKTAGELKRSYRSVLYRLRNARAKKRPRSRQRFPRPK